MTAPETGTAAAPAAAPPRIFEAEYYERMRRLEGESWWNAALREVAAMLLDDAALPASGTVLDVGCGSGQTMTWALGRLGPRWKAIGLDVSPEGVAAARALGLDVMEASALNMPLPAASVDLVITLDVIQHLPLGGGDLTALREMRRVLRPGGHLFVRTNAQAFPHAPDDAEYNFHKYEPGPLRATLAAAGFDVIRLSRINALLGLAEIPRELRASREQGRRGYHGILGKPKPQRGLADALKRRWLVTEGRMVRRGLQLPMGRTIVALCRAGDR